MTTLALCGDVMLGRGVDQILPHPGDPALHERHARSALAYVALAERANGAIRRPVGFSYVWGDALPDLLAADARIINLETSVTTSPCVAPKGINYRMQPRNVGALRAARIDCCVLANNHVLDWGRAGLLETLETLERAGIRTAGAGCDIAHAAAPAVIERASAGRLLVFAFGLPSSGIPETWAAGPASPGVHLLTDLSPAELARIAAAANAVRRPGDIAIASIHWGGNWGYHIPDAFRAFAHGLIDQAGFALVHGHSSHHPQGIEVHHGRLVLYGAGDFLNDYEGIGGREAFRGELTALYLARLVPESGALRDLELLPLRIGKMRLNRASEAERQWLRDRLDRESRRFGVQLDLRADGRIDAAWQPAGG